MSPVRYVIASLTHRWQSHLAVTVVAAVATAILTGALVIGDAVRLSLRGLALDRLGHIDRMMVTPGLFRDRLAEDLAQAPGFDDHFTRAASLLIVTASAEHRSSEGSLRASNVQIVGYPGGFWELSRVADQSNREGVLATQSVANELQLEAGGELLLRLPVLGAMPADSALGDRYDATLAEPVTIDNVISGTGLARFGIFASQHEPRTLFVPLAQLQRMMQLAGQANTLVIGSADVGRPTGDEAAAWLDEHFHPQLIDYGLSLIDVGNEPRQLLQLASSQLVLPDEQVTAIRAATQGADWQGVSTYLANAIELGDRKIAYSLVTGVDSRVGVGPLLDATGQPIRLADDEIALNDWAAGKLKAKVGDTITFRYYEPESTHGDLVERKSPPLTVAAIVPLAGDDGTATRAADPQLTPELAGVTDSATIDDWDVPFELTEPIMDDDDVYWDEHRTTPKAFISFDLARKLFASRWGSVSLLRLPVTDVESPLDAASLSQQLNPAAVGLRLQPAKANALAAASGTTPFDGLFFGFSMFLIASAVMLLVIVFGLVLAQRYGEVGILLAVGIPRRLIGRWLGAELLLVGILGAVVGVAAGVAYAALMVWGLTTVWVDAIATPFLSLHVTPRSLVLGLLLGTVASAIVTWRVLRKVVRRPAIGLIAGRDEPTESTTNGPSALRGPWLVGCLAAAALAAGVAGVLTRGEAQAGAFFGCGAAALATLLTALHRLLVRAARGRRATKISSLSSLAAANLYRKPLASTLLTGLVAAASFLLLSISAFRLAPSDEGTGGFDWIATSDQPLLFDPNTPQGQLELGFSVDDERRMEQVHVVSLRANDGEAASCLHLFKPEQPRVIGVPVGELTDSQFAWAGHDPVEDDDSPWSLLLETSTGEEVPCILDANTALYSLQLYGGVGSTFTIRDGDNQPVTMRVAGLLKNSVLQGDVIVGDDAFRRMFPDVAGHRLFLVADKAETDAPALDQLLEERLQDVGFDMVLTRNRLAEFLAVQNTYLSTFQTLGGLGLLLGTVGLAAVELRNLLARRGELALLRACGYRRRRLLALVMLENLWLLLGGLLLGAVAAGAALVPPALVQETRPPVIATAIMLGTVLFVGVVASWLATRRVVRAPIVPALRGD